MKKTLLDAIFTIHFEANWLLVRIGSWFTIRILVRRFQVAFLTCVLMFLCHFENNCIFATQVKRWMVKRISQSSCQNKHQQREFRSRIFLRKVHSMLLVMTIYSKFNMAAQKKHIYVRSSFFKAVKTTMLPNLGLCQRFPTQDYANSA